jgi:hypothetical protein
MHFAFTYNIKMNPKELIVINLRSCNIGIGEKERKALSEEFLIVFKIGIGTTQHYIYLMPRAENAWNFVYMPSRFFIYVMKIKKHSHMMQSVLVPNKRL